MQIIPLSEGAFTIDKSKKFVPFDLKNDDLQNRSVGSLLVEIQPFLVITSKDILLLDSGLGFVDPDGIMQIHKNMSMHGINATDVTKVLMTHLHKDHAGGISLHTKSGVNNSLSFENATYYINKDEFDLAIGRENPSYKIEDIKPLINNDRVVLTEGNGIIDNYIKYEVSGGHSVYHQVYWIIDQGEKIFFGGDVAPQVQQMKSRFVAKYDSDGKRSMELRQQWWKQGAQEKWTFLFYHDLKTPVFEFKACKKIGLP